MGGMGVELATGQQPDLFEKEALPIAFTEGAVAGPKRHGYPFASLLLLVKGNSLCAPALPIHSTQRHKASRATPSIVLHFPRPPFSTGMSG
jgi:hypothetical protein